MAAIAGFTNAVALLSVLAMPVSSVSGTSSKIGMYAVLGNSAKLLTCVLLLFFFCLGAFVTGILIRAQTFKLGKFFGVVMMIQSFLIFMALDLFVGETSPVAQFCLAMAMGMQNASATRFSGAVVRTTHLTGITTDIGLILGNYLRWGDTANLWRLKVFFSLMAGFIGGSALGAVGFLKISTTALIFPGVFTLIAGIIFFTHDVLWGHKGWCMELVPDFILEQLVQQRENRENEKEKEGTKDVLVNVVAMHDTEAAK